jgi:hypothetical protein
MKGQTGMMEYILMVFFIMVIIVVLIIFLSGWQVTQLQLEKSKGSFDRALSVTKMALDSPYLVKEDSMFDDTKLASALRPGMCEEMEKVFGQNWFLEVCTGECMGCEGECVVCEANAYDPDCNYWSLCKSEGRYDAYVLPVNVYRKMAYVYTDSVFPRTDLGTLKVGVFFEVEP